MKATIYKISKNAIPRTSSADFTVDLSAWAQTEVRSYTEENMVMSFRSMYDRLGGWDKSYDNVMLVLHARMIVQCVQDVAERSSLLDLLESIAEDEILYVVLA